MTGTIAALPATTTCPEERVVRVRRFGVMVVGPGAGVPGSVMGRLIVSVWSTPVPETAATCGLPAAESRTDRLPLDVVEVVGWKVTKTVQPALLLSDAGQLFVCVNPAGRV